MKRFLGWAALVVFLIIIGGAGAAAIVDFARDWIVDFVNGLRT